MIFCVGSLAESNGMIPSRMYNMTYHTQLGSNHVRRDRLACMLQLPNVSRVHPVPTVDLRTWSAQPATIKVEASAVLLPVRNIIPALAQPASQ